MDDSHNIKALGNKQLGLHYEVTYQKLDEIKIEIIEDITDLLGQAPKIGFETYQNPQKFCEYCKQYRSNIEKEKKELFLLLIKKEEDIQQEIIRRQRNMLFEIGIETPSIRVFEIIQEMKWTNFQVFDELIRFIKMAKKWQGHKRPQGKKILAPQKLIEKYEKFGWIITVLAKNLWPYAN